MNWISGTSLVVIMGAAGYMLEPWMGPPLISMLAPKAPAATADAGTQEENGEAEEPVEPKRPEATTKVEEPPATAPVDTPDLPSQPETPREDPGAMAENEAGQAPEENIPPATVTPEPADEIAQNPAPTPAVETPPEPPAPPAELGPEQIVSLMQNEIRGGSIKEFTFDQVQGWRAGEDVEDNGETYQSGEVSYKATTIFGEKLIMAQAWIKDGKIVKWIWPNSGMEIK